MSYVLSAVSSFPTGLWPADDSAPFVDKSGYGHSATLTGTQSYSVPLVPGVTRSSVFTPSVTASIPSDRFLQGQEAGTFALEAWVLPIPKTTTGQQAIMSHSGQFDGLSINGKVISFTTKYATAGEARASYELQDYQRVHLVGIHNEKQNRLFVNGVLVAEVDLTDDQKQDVYSVNSATLVVGASASTQEFAGNAFAIYKNIGSEDIANNYAAGNSFKSTQTVVNLHNGEPLMAGGDQGEAFMKDTYGFEDGTFTDTAIGPNDELLPDVDEDMLSTGGTWLGSFPLELAPNPMYGIQMDWDGLHVTIEASLNGTTWETVQKGRIIDLTEGANPIDTDLEIRVTFEAGIDKDNIYLNWLTVTGYSSGDVLNFPYRDITTTGNVTFRRNGEFYEFSDRNGILINSGSLTITPPSADDSIPDRTVEFWVKRLDSTAFTHGVTGTSYVNGAAGSTLPIGQWVLLTVVASADISTNIVLTGNAVVASVSTYPTALSAGDVAEIYADYAGNRTSRVEESDVIGVSGDGNNNLYAHEWEVGGGG